MGALQQAIASYGGAAAATYLDGLSPAPRAVHSLRKMISTATNSVRVRRSSDNAEQDIGFTGNALDTTSLATFVGANSAFVVTWYDQTGNGYNQVQATASKQPRIVNAGVYDGKLVYDGTDDSMSVPSLPFGTPYVGLYVKSKILRQSPVGVAYETSANFGSNAGAFIVYMELNIFGVGIRAAANWRRDYNPASQTTLQQMDFLLQMAVADGTTRQQRFFLNGVEDTTNITVGTAATPVVNFTAQTMYCGGRAGTSLYFALWEETKAIYDADTTSIRASIEAIVA